MDADAEAEGHCNCYNAKSKDSILSSQTDVEREIESIGRTLQEQQAERADSMLPDGAM